MTGELPVDSGWIARCHVGENVDLVDTRGDLRELRIVEPGLQACTAEVWDSTYIETGTLLT